MTLLALFQRITGAETRALRHQRDAHAEQADKERRRADAAERERDDAVAQMARHDVLHHFELQLSVDRGQTILKLQHRLTRWQRRYRRAMVALHAWRPEAQAWEQRAREAQERANDADRLLRSLMRGEPGAAARAANYVAGCRVADIGPETWMPGEQTPSE